MISLCCFFGVVFAFLCLLGVEALHLGFFFITFVRQLKTFQEGVVGVKSLRGVGLVFHFFGSHWRLRVFLNPKP